MGRAGVGHDAARTPGLLAVLTHEGVERRLRPGGVLTIGRHSENDLVIDRASVSRVHASICWTYGQPEPEIVDHGSQNGTTVNGERVERDPVPLRDKARLLVGLEAIQVQLAAPALLEDAPEVVALFCEVGAEVKGEAEQAEDLCRILRLLEIEQRTGTLRVRHGDTVATITFGLGKIVAAQSGDALCTRALEQILTAPGPCRYHFTADLEPTDDSMNLWFSDFLRRWQRGFTPRRPQRTMRVRDRQTG